MNNGSWFPSGDPASLTGGIDLAPLAGDLLYATVQGSGDAGISLNAGATPFAFSVPAGFTAGLPAAGGGFTTLDPAKCSGSAGLSDGNLHAGFSNSAGVAQTVDGYKDGAYYFELYDVGVDIFSNSWGGGMGRNYSIGGDWVHWFGGEFNGTDINGGALVTGEGLGQPLASLVAFGSTVASHVFDFAGNSGNVCGIAIFIAHPPSKIELQNLEVTTNRPVPIDDAFVTMRYSDDGGRRWHEKRTQTIGAIGDFHKNIQFRNLGQGRNKLIEVSWSAPCKTAFGGGTINVEVGGS